MMPPQLFNHPKDVLLSGVLLFVIFLTTLVLSGCFPQIIALRTSNNGTNQENNDFPAEFLKDESIDPIATKVGNRFRLKIDKRSYFGGGAGIAVNRDGSVQYLYFHYKTYEQVVTKDEARALIIQVVDELKRQIHSKEHFGSYFYYYPLEKGQLVVAISFRKLITKGLLFFDDRWSTIEAPWIGMVGLDRSERVCYNVYDDKSRGKDTEYQEPLEKAREIVQKQKESTNTLPIEKSTLK